MQPGHRGEIGVARDAADGPAGGGTGAADDVETLLDQALLAEAAGDLDGAVERLQAAIDRHPGTEAAYLRASALCRRLDRPQEAELILLEGMCWLPGAAGLFGAHAAIAADRQDWGQAARRYRLARERFPSDPWTHAHLATALRRAGRPLEAEQALLRGDQHVAHDAHFLIEHAEVAAEREDWAEAVRRFEAAADRFPASWWARKRQADMLKRAGRPDEAEATLLDAQRRFPNEPALFGDHADLAFDRRDWAEALRRFEAARDRFPELWWPYKRMGEALKASNRVSEAEAILLEGQQRIPGEAALFIDHAELAFDREDWTEALRRFGIVRDRFPGMWWPYRRIAQALRGLQRLEEAERAILDGIELFPDEPAMLFEHGELKHMMGPAEAALAIHQNIHGRFPDIFWSHFLLARSLAAAYRLDEAESTLVRTMDAFPDDPLPVIELVHLTGRIPAATRQVSFAVLDGMLVRWIERLGETEDLLLARAQLAQVDGDYQGCLQRLVHLARLHPGARLVEEKIAGIREIMLGQGELIPDGLGDGAAAAPPGGDEALRDLLGRFESLGGGGPEGSTRYGCEFGFLQRHVKLEPLSLLRWTGVNLHNVTRLLVGDFAGVGNPETSTLNGFEGVYDWCFVDTAYGLHCDHTHLARLTVPREDALRMMCQRTVFLARKLREDLEDGDKIFVYRYAGELGDEADVLALADAVNGYGNSMLFFVCRADARHPPLTVRLVHPGLMVGHIDWFTVDRLGYPVNLDGWSALCRQGLRLWQGLRTPVEATPA